MYITQRAVTFARGLVKRYGPSRIKRHLWDAEFSEGKWNFIDDTAGDCVYQYLERYLASGSILDLGCGPGNTANELAIGTYQTYVGVDISDAALDKARKRSVECGRSGKNRFAQGDFLSYVPTQQFNVILFRESLYHIPVGKIKTVLDRYVQYLKADGVFIVRMFVSDTKDGQEKHRPKVMMGIVEREFDVIEKRKHSKPGPTVIVFRPKREARSNATA